MALCSRFPSSGRSFPARSHQECEARHVIGDDFEADFGFGTGDADGADITAVHGRFDMAEYMLDADTDAGALSIRGLLFRRQRLVAILTNFSEEGC